MHCMVVATRALQLLEQLKDMERQQLASPRPFALIYLGLGDKNEAIKYLEQILQYRGGSEATFVQTSIHSAVILASRKSPMQLSRPISFAGHAKLTTSILRRRSCSPK
jgi:hypothetical protein